MAGFLALRTFEIRLVIFTVILCGYLFRISSKIHRCIILHSKLLISFPLLFDLVLGYADDDGAVAGFLYLFIYLLKLWCSLWQFVWVNFWCFDNNCFFKSSLFVVKLVKKVNRRNRVEHSNNTSHTFHYIYSIDYDYICIKGCMYVDGTTVDHTWISVITPSIYLFT